MKARFKIFLFVISVFLVVNVECASKKPVKFKWAERTLKKLSLEEKIGQLFMISVYSDYMDTKDSLSKAENLIKKYNIGGLMFLQGSAKDQVKATNYLQSKSKYPLLVSQDSEWGLSMRLNDAEIFPKNTTLGAIKDESLIYELGKEIGKQCRAIGVHINFAPVVDINSNPNNPIIGVRSFGDNKVAVAHKAKLFAQGLRAVGCIDCAKHFPGHGDTEKDSHLALPVVKHSLKRLQEEELYPFKALIDSGVEGVMVAHLSVPALDKSGVPASGSRLIVTDLLKEKLGFKGLIFTDYMDMKGLSKKFKPGEAALMALNAGNDILLCSSDFCKSAISYLIEVAKKGFINKSELNEHVLKILKAKEKLGLHKNKLVPEYDIDKVLCSFEALKLRKKLYESAITVINNEDKILPLRSGSSFAFVDFDLDWSYFGLGTEYKEILEQLGSVDTVVLRIFRVSRKQGIYGFVPGIEDIIKNFFKWLSDKNKKVIIILCMSPYALRFLPKVPTIVAYEEEYYAIQAAEEALFGKLECTGTLPIRGV